ncbi:tail protein [Chitinimonas prasina]|uniref:Tail protein n=1 Tax=Chitinimonas prasina TaxID=1434937 RepID=A0ABQ5YHX4_9NEIS|nr:phage tail protein [Chitinimonas prasina]GLR13257.1 tail protein [Chitinimonas prasina]
MYKPQSLRDHLSAMVPGLNTNPDKLLLFVESGKLRTTGAGSLSFQYHYTLNVVLLDFAAHADTVFVPILMWLREHQLDLLLNHDKQSDGFQFEAELLNHETADLSIKLALTERVIVKEAKGGLDVRHAQEPKLAHHDKRPWELFIRTDKVA